MLGVVATVVFLMRLVPQPVRLARTGVPDGVSAMSAANTTIAELAWLVYGLSVGLVPLWAVSIPAFPLGVFTVVLLRREFTRRDIIGSGVWLGAILAAWLTGTLVLALAAGVVVNVGPQVWTALRSPNLDGLAPATWLIALVDASVWGVYGWWVGDPALLGYCAVLLGFATVILVRIASTSRLSLGSVRSTDLDPPVGPLVARSGGFTPSGVLVAAGEQA